MSGKSLVFKLLPKMISNDQIPIFQKDQSCKNELSHEADFVYVNEISIWICLA